MIGEAEYRYNQDAESQGLAGTVKLGGWHHFGRFDDTHFGIDGKSLADPTSIGQPRVHRGDFAVYGVIDQMLWHLPGEGPKKGIGGFARVAASPSDRNLMSFYAEAGVNFIGIWAQRPDDTFGCAVAFSQLSPPLGALDRDTNFFAGDAAPVRSYELALELTYQAQIGPSWIVQPDFQYIFRPSGGVVDPDKPYCGADPRCRGFRAAHVDQLLSPARPPARTSRDLSVNSPAPWRPRGSEARPEARPRHGYSAWPYARRHPPAPRTDPA